MEKRTSMKERRMAMKGVENGDEGRRAVVRKYKDTSRCLKLKFRSNSGCRILTGKRRDVGAGVAQQGATAVRRTMGGIQMMVSGTLIDDERQLSEERWAAPLINVMTGDGNISVMTTHNI